MSFNFMAAATVHSGFEAQENKICHYFHFVPFYLPWSGPHTFVFWSLCFKRSLIWWILTTSNLPWFMDLTFQAPMQYCSLQHRTLLPSPVTLTTGCCFCFGSVCVYAAAAKSLQSCPTLCDPIDGSPPGSPVPGLLQARTLEWVAMSFSSAWKW